MISHYKIIILVIVIKKINKFIFFFGGGGEGPFYINNARNTSNGKIYNGS